MKKKMVMLRVEGDPAALSSLSEILSKNKDGLDVSWESKQFHSKCGGFTRVHYYVNVPIMEVNGNGTQHNQ